MTGRDAKRENVIEKEKEREIENVREIGIEIERGKERDSRRKGRRANLGMIFTKRIRMLVARVNKKRTIPRRNVPN